MKVSKSASNVIFGRSFLTHIQEYGYRNDQPNLTSYSLHKLFIDFVNGIWREPAQSPTTAILNSIGSSKHLLAKLGIKEQANSLACDLAQRAYNYL